MLTQILGKTWIGGGNTQSLTIYQSWLPPVVLGNSTRVSKRESSCLEIRSSARFLREI